MSRTVVQVTSFLSPGDGVSNIIRGLHQEFLTRGNKSFICARGVGAPELREYEDLDLSRLSSHLARAAEANTLFIYHYGICDEHIDPLLGPGAFNGHKVFYYHNVTPGRFFRGWDPEIEKVLTSTRTGLSKFLREGWSITGDSRFNLRELEGLGDNRFLPPVLPTPIPPTTPRTNPDPEAGQDIHMLFVGRFAPNKRQDLLLYAIKDLLNHRVRCRLTLAGKGGGRYVKYVRNLVRLLGLNAQVEFVLDASDAKISELLSSSQFLPVASEHEGFCMPVLEAMQRGCLPIVRPYGALKEIFEGAPVLSNGESESDFLDTVLKVVKEASTFDARSRLAARTHEVARMNLKDYWSQPAFVKHWDTQSADNKEPIR